MHGMVMIHRVEVMHVMIIMHMMIVVHVVEVMHVMIIVHVVEVVHMVEVVHVMEIIHVTQIHAAMAMGFRSIFALGRFIYFSLIRTREILLVILRHGSRCRLLHKWPIRYHGVPPFYHTLQYA